MSNAYFDIDSVTEATDEKIAEIELFYVKTEPYFSDLRLRQPIKALSGNGIHLLFALPAIKVNEHPDIKERLNQFRQQFYAAFAKELSGLELRLDNTMDLSRLAKIYGTKKPNCQRLSRFYGGKRVEDEKLRDYLLGMSIDSHENDAPLSCVPEALPEKFVTLLGLDEKLRELWDGTGKADGDVSCSGYDFSIVRRCLYKGITDINELFAILALRPKGAVQCSGKGEHYIRYTIANAIKR